MAFCKRSWFWFPCVTLNPCFNLFRFHVAGGKRASGLLVRWWRFQATCHIECFTFLPLWFSCENDSWACLKFSLKQENKHWLFYRHNKTFNNILVTYASVISKKVVCINWVKPGRLENGTDTDSFLHEDFLTNKNYSVWVHYHASVEILLELSDQLLKP